MRKLIVIGIDSLDPNLLLKFRKELPNFSHVISNSSTFTSESIFPVDTIPAWGSIYTGLNPSNHGLLYIYDVFDPKLSDLSKLNVHYLRGKTFWDYLSKNNYKVGVIYPMLMYPSWEVNGVMISKSPFDERINWIKTEIDINTYPKLFKAKYNIPDKFENLWGGFPGDNYLGEWAKNGLEILANEASLGLKVYKNEDFDFYFIYFSLLDILQHRTWRFFDKKDPTYPGDNDLSKIILNYYKFFDGLIGKFLEISPDSQLIVLSDHGHRSRPVKTINLNEHLRKMGYLELKSKNTLLFSKFKNSALKIVNKLNIEPLLIKLIVKNNKMSQISKSFYSSSRHIDTKRSKSYLSNFAGIKSYSYGGFEINKELLSKKEYVKIKKDLVENIPLIKDSNGNFIVNWIKEREKLYNGDFTSLIYPDLVFELTEEYAVGWDVNLGLFGKSFDHKVASGGHSKKAVFLTDNIDKILIKNKISLLDIAPTILNLMDINWKEYKFDGKSIFN
ncbi:alkaline phosphatase family protein [Methanobacterium sp. MZD130B]|uniref:alkaline phosphatase family protein n=1 Tax=Methanobacterium sp. MZD130B TaxID=3394378 RepID=UPI0039FBFB78